MALGSVKKFTKSDQIVCLKGPQQFKIPGKYTRTDYYFIFEEGKQRLKFEQVDIERTL